MQEYYVLTKKEAKYSYQKPRALKMPHTQNSRREKKKKKKKQKIEEIEKKSNKLTILTNNVIKHKVL